MKRPLGFLLATTIVAAISVQPAAAAPVSEDVPVPGGRAALAARLNVDPVPDRARFVSEMARLLYGRADRKAFAPEVLAAELRGPAGSDVRGNEVVPVPLTAELWSDAVFRRRVRADELVVAILSDRQAALVCHGLAALDDETLQYFADQPAVLRQIYTLAAEPFAVFSNGLQVRMGRVIVPGGDQAVTAWEAVVGESVTRPDRFMTALFTLGEGRIAGLYDTIGQLDPPRQRFALGLWMREPAARVDALRALAVATLGASGEWRAIRTQPFVRQAYDFTSALTRVSVDAEGRPTAPSSRGFWSRVMGGPDVPADPAIELTGIDEQPVDAAWLAGLTTTNDVLLRAERLDQFAFGQRVFVEAMPDERADVFVAARAFRRYRMLMVTLERLGIRKPALYASAARLASRLSQVDPARAFTAIAQFQGALALLRQMRMVGSLDVARAEALVTSLLVVPLHAESQYMGGILRWLSEELRPAIPMGVSMESAILAAVAGPDTSTTAPRIEWEGQRYRVDVAAGERRRLERVRERQGGATLEMALDIASAAHTLAAAPPTLAAVQEVTTALTMVVEGLSAEARQGAFLDRGDFPPGVVPPPNTLDTLVEANDELKRITDGAALSRATGLAANLLTAADEAAAQSLVSLVYAMNLGDPDGAALLPGNISRRHDFGFGQRDTGQRLRAAWMTPRQDVSPGVPWHIDGSLLGLEVAMATSALRRLNIDRVLQAPSLTSNERETFAVGFALMNPFALTDRTRDAIAEGIERGRRRVSMLRGPADTASVASELNMDGWRRRALHWTVVNEPGRVESQFSLRELMAVAGSPDAADLDAWGTSAMDSAGCMCTKMPAPGRLPLVTGRRQIGLLATAVPDLNLHVARMLFRLRLPARLAKYVLSAAVLDFVEEVRGTDTDDWLSLVRGAAAVPQERIEDYVAAAAADGPLVSDSPR